MARVRLERQDATHIRAVAGADDAASVLNIKGLWRINEANVVGTHPGGAAADYAIFATAKAQNVVNAPNPNTDNTDYSWALAITGIAATPPIVAGVVDVYRRIGRLHWDGAAITQVWQEVPGITGAMIEDAAFANTGEVTVTRLASGALQLDVGAIVINTADIADGAVTALKVNAALKPSGGAAAGTEALRALGATAATAAAGNDARLSDARAPTAHAASHLPAGSDPVVKTFQTSHTFVIPGPVNVPNGQLDYNPPISIPIKAGQSVSLAKMRARVNNGGTGGVPATVSYKLQRNGADIAGFGTTAAPIVTPLNATWQTTDPADVALADGDDLSLVILAIAGVPMNMSVTVVLEHSV